MTYDSWKTTEPEPFDEYPPDEMEETMAPIAKPMKGNQLANIVFALGCAHEYGVAAMLNSNGDERASLERLMLNRLRLAAENAEITSTSKRSKAA